MRRVRENEMDKLKRALRKQEKSSGKVDPLHSIDEEDNGEIDKKELVRLFRCLGYMPDSNAVAEVMAAAGIRTGMTPDDESHCLSELWRLLQLYRGREGLNKEDAKEINETFGKHECKGSISLNDVGKVLRSIGYAISFDLQQTVCAKVDLANEGELTAGEMRKLVRMIRDEDISLMKKEFDKMKKAGSDTVPIQEARRALLAIGCCNPDGTPPQIPSQTHCDKGMIDLQGFCTVALVKRREARRLFQKNGGFSADDLSELRKLFTHFDLDGSGDIARKELINLLEQLMPSYANDPHERPTLIRLIEEVDENGDGGLEFHEFVRLVRRLHDFETLARLGKETKVIDDTGFALHEVQGFREVFMTKSCGLRELSFPDVRAIMQRICPMGTKQTEELVIICAEILKSEIPDSGLEEGQKHLLLDFPDFLRLMKKVMDNNFAQVRERFGFGCPLSGMSALRRSTMKKRIVSSQQVARLRAYSHQFG